MKNGFRESPDTAVHILLDSSGSMTDSSLMLANAVCYAVGKALQGIPGVNLGITAFPGANRAKRGQRLPLFFGTVKSSPPDSPKSPTG